MIKLKNWMPFSIEIRFNPDELIEAVADAAPIGKHEHDHGLRFKRFLPRAGGKLKNWFRNRANWHLIAPVMRFGGTAFHSKARRVRMWTITPRSIPYAAIQEFGGSVAAASGRLMRWMGDGGKMIVTRFRKGYNIKALEYAKRGLTKFAMHDLDVKVRWK